MQFFWAEQRGKESAKYNYKYISKITLNNWNYISK